MKPIKITGLDLKSIIDDQYHEAYNAINLRLPSWLYLYDSWRGIYRNTGYYDSNSKSLPKYLWQAFGKVDRLKRDNQEYEIFFREIFRVVEGFLARIDRAYLIQSRPFTLNPPMVYKSIDGDPAAMKAKLQPAEDWLCYEYRRRATPDELIMTMRDMCLADVGYAVVKTDQTGWVPVAYEARFKPWEVLPDPYGRTAANWGYAAYRETKTVREALVEYPEAKKAFDENTVELDKRKIVQWLHFIGTYGKEIEELADRWGKKLPADKLVDIVVLCKADGTPSDIVLENYVNPWQEIPIQDFGMINDPEENGPYRMSLAATITDIAEGINKVGNRLIEQSEYATLLTGFYDSQYSTEFADALRTPAPGEWMPVPLSGKDVQNALYPLKFPDYSGHHMLLMDRMRTEEGRVTGQQDFNYGISTPTQTNTLGETNLLKGESNEIFRAKAQRLDASFERLHRICVLATATAIKKRLGTKEIGIIYIKRDNEVVPLDPTVFDEGYEVNLVGGAQNIDGPQKAMKSLLYAEKAMQMGVTDIDPNKVIKNCMELDGMDPYSIMRTPEEVEKLKKEQALQALAAIAQAAGGGNPQLPPTTGAAPSPPPPLNIGGVPNV